MVEIAKKNGKAIGGMAKASSSGVNVAKAQRRNAASGRRSEENLQSIAQRKAWQKQKSMAAAATIEKHHQRTMCGESG